MKKITLIAAIVLCGFTSCYHHHQHTTATEAVENSIYASSEDVMECHAESEKNYRVNGGTIATKCHVAVSCDGVEFVNTTRFVWWNQHGLCWQVAKDLREITKWQQEEAARKTALREWADTL